MSEVIIKADNIYKSYVRYKSNHQKLHSLILGRDVGEKIDVLKGVSFEIYRGDRVVILGGSRSGKTSLMRVLAGIIEPDSGSVTINGDVTTMFDHRLGFEPVLSVKSNYVARATLRGWTRQQIKEREESIMTFAALTDQLNDPLRLCNAGSPARLGFTIDTEFSADVLLYDEGFGLGGKKFANRCIKRLYDILKKDASCFVMTAGDMNAAEKLCNRGIVLHEGTIVFDGNFEDARNFHKEKTKAKPKEEKSSEETDRSYNPEEPLQRHNGETGADNHETPDIEEHVDVF